MSGAATAASFCRDQAHYVITPKDLPPDSPIMNRLVVLPVPNIPYHNSLIGTKLVILRFVSKRNGKVSNKMIKEALGLSAQTLSYHIRQLDKKTSYAVRGRNRFKNEIFADNKSRKTCGIMIKRLKTNFDNQIQSVFKYSEQSDHNYYVILLLDLNRNEYYYRAYHYGSLH
jgi:DNA-binding transcriptional ArsR family regulator